ncbi:MAG: hypothetical protein M5R36_19740 [Deltaproteobacteria bacterium]|nr:hypothetical protein [Deltaproteobacteria bacterium]
MASPKRTFAAGVATATLSGKAVYVAEGDYSWAIDDYVFVSVYGGYEPIGWTRDIPSQMTRLVIPGGDAGLIASTLQNIPIVLEGLTIVGEAVLDGSPPDTLTSYLVLFADLAVISQDRILAGGSSRWARALDAWGPTLVVNSEIGIEGFVPETSDDLASTVMADRLLVLVNSTVRGGSTTTPNVTSYGIYAGDLMSVITVINSLVTGGSVPGPRGRTAAIYAAGVKVFPPFVTVANSIIDSGQSARAGGFHLMVPWFMLLLNSDVWGAALTCYYDMILDFGIPMCLRQPGQLNRPPVVWTQAFDNISADPLLAGDGIHLLDGSSCIDAGFDLMTYPDLWLPWSQIYGIDLAQLISQDIDGDPRPQDWGWDIGPDEWVPR